MKARIIWTVRNRWLCKSMLQKELGGSNSLFNQTIRELLTNKQLLKKTQGRAIYYRRAQEASYPKPTVFPLSEIGGTESYQFRNARCCYAHLAGRAGTDLMRWLLLNKYVKRDKPELGIEPDQKDKIASCGKQRLYTVTKNGISFFQSHKIITQEGQILNYCVDRTESRHHLSGLVGSALLSSLIAKGLFSKTHHRSLVITKTRKRVF